MYMITYVAMDEIYNYYPIVKFSNTLEKAQEVLELVQEELEQQTKRIEDLFEGKIISEPFLQEVDFKIYVSEDL